ncbi:MAG: PHB depolymerase family esterase [Myxococcota bacterium]
MRSSLLVVVLISGCAHARPPADPDLRPGSLESGGRTRTYLSWSPGKPGAPLVVALHGRMGTAVGMEQLSALTAIAKREGFTVVFPDGVDKSWHDARDWGPAADQGVDDVAFLRALIDDFLAKGADPRRVFMLGMSNGGFMTLTFACRAADKVTAVASITGGVSAPLAKDCPMSRPVPTAFFMGSDDRLVPFHGGKVANGRGETLSADASARFFAAKNGCQGEPVVEKLPDVAPDDGTRVELRRWSGCRGNGHVELYVIEGGGHTWPGGWQYAREFLIGKTSKDLSASEAAWRFFAAH